MCTRRGGLGRTMTAGAITRSPGPAPPEGRNHLYQGLHERVAADYSCGHNTNKEEEFPNTEECKGPDVDSGSWGRLGVGGETNR